MQKFPDFTDTELWVIRSTVEERYNKKVPIELVDTEIRLSPGAKELTACPAVYFEARKAHFIIIKVGEECYRCQFYYRLHQMYGTGIDEFSDLADCIVTLLQVQADHARQQRQESAN